MNKTEIKSVPIAELRNLWSELERDRRDHVRLAGKYRQHNNKAQRAEYYARYLCSIATSRALADAQGRLKRTIEDHAKAIKEAQAREKATSANAA